MQQRPRTKSVMHVQIKLLFCSFKPIVAHGLFCRHCICLSSLLFEGPPTTSVLRVVQRNTLTAYRKTFHTVRRAIEWPQNSYRTFSWSLQKFHITFRSWLKLFAFLPTTFFETAVYKHIKVPSVSVLQSITLLVFPEPNRNIFWTYNLYVDPGSAR